MKTLSQLLRACAASAALVMLAISAAAAELAPPRIGMVNGDASFWRPGAKDWTPAQVNIALAPGDAVYTAEGATVEVQIGARAYIRMAQHAMLTLLENEPGIARFKLTSGIAAFDLRSLPTGRSVEIDTPMAAFNIDGAGYYRIEIADDTTHFIARRGGDATVTLADGTSRRIAPSQEAVVRDEEGGSVETYVAPSTDAWDDWNFARTDNLLDAITNRYVSPEVYGTDDLDHHGRWRVTPEYGAVWVPSNVGPDWAPYSTGSWVWDPYYAWTWVDTAPWGWAPYHYGRWVHVGGFWAWAPGPRVVYPTYAPALVAFFQSGGGGMVTSFGGPAVSWVALSWGEPCFPWWGRSGFVGKPWWGGWGGPRIVNNVVVQHNTTVIHNIRNINFRNARERNALIAMPRKSFGQGRIAEVQRLEPVPANEWKPVAGRHPIKPSAVSLAPTVSRSVAPAQELMRRPAVAARSVASPMTNRESGDRPAGRAGAATAQSRPSQTTAPWAPFGRLEGPERKAPRRTPDPPRVETQVAPSVPAMQQKLGEHRPELQRDEPGITPTVPEGPRAWSREPPQAPPRQALPPMQRQRSEGPSSPRPEGAPVRTMPQRVERPEAMRTPEASVPTLQAQQPVRPPAAMVAPPQLPHVPGVPQVQPPRPVAAPRQQTLSPPPLLNVPRPEAPVPMSPRQALGDRPESPGLLMQQTPRLPGQPANQLYPRRIQRDAEQVR